MIAEPSYAFAKGCGRFGIGYTRLATALGNFEQGDIEAESAVVAQWLTSGLRIAMFRTGWNLLSTRFSLTKVPGSVLSDSCRKGTLSLRRWQIVHTTNMARITTPKTDGISSVGGSLRTPSSDSNSRPISRHSETTWAAVRKPPTQPPPLLRPWGGPTGGGSSVVDIGHSFLMDWLQQWRGKVSMRLRAREQTQG